MKGIILAAGRGTRLFPVTKTIPKEMLPLVNKPLIAFVIEELVLSGITEILVISAPGKDTLESFCTQENISSTLAERGHTCPPLHFAFLRQTEMNGTGHALMLAIPFLENQPAIVAYPDDLHFGSPPLSHLLLETYRQSGCSVLATLHNPPHLERYGVVQLANDGEHVIDIIEKPPLHRAPSREVSLGRYLYTSDFFPLLHEGWEKHREEGEYHHIYALRRCMEKGRVLRRRAPGKRFDAGSPEGILEASLFYASLLSLHQSALPPSHVEEA